MTMKIEEDVYQARLAELQAACIKKLTDLAAEPLADRRVRQENCFLEILKDIGQHIHTFLSPTQRVGQGCDLYFWPGYESILRLRGERRIGPVVRFDADNVSAGFRYCTRGDCSNCPEGEVIFTVAAFHHLLGRYRETVNGVMFSPGSTHLWAARGPRLKLEGRNIARPIEFLNVSTAPPNRDSVSSHGIVTVPLHRLNPLKWGPELGRRLNQVRSIESSVRWPVPLDQEPDDAGSRTRHEIRLALYSLWLAATFRPADFFQDGWVDSIKKRLMRIDKAGLGALIGRIGQLQNREWIKGQGVSPQSFNRWYTLILQPTVDVPFLVNANLLGSAMLFCNQRLHPQLLREIRRTIEIVYLNMRYLEIALLNEQQGLQVQAYGFAHDIKKVTAVLSDMWVVPLRSLFHVASDVGPSADLHSAIGTVEIHQPDLAVDLGITPFRSSILAVGTIMRLWSELDLKQDFKGLDSERLDLMRLVHSCWDRVKAAAVATMLAGQGYDLSNVDDLRKALRIRSQLLDLFNKCPFEVVGGAPRMNLSEGRATIVARLVFSILKNALQHTDPLNPINVFIRLSDTEGTDKKLIGLRCTNSRFNWEDEDYPPARIQEFLGVDAETAELLAFLLPRRTFGFEEITPAYARSESSGEGANHRRAFKAFSSRDTIELCVRTLGGPPPRIPEPDDTSPEYVIDVWIPFEEANDAIGNH